MNVSQLSQMLDRRPVSKFRIQDTGAPIASVTRLLKVFAGLALTINSAALAQDKPVIAVSGQELPAGRTLQLNPPTAGAATINLPQGSAPTAPNNGDCWMTAIGLYCRVNGITVGPMAGLGNSNNLTGSLTIGTAPEILQAGPAAPVSSAQQAIDWTIASNADRADLINAGGYWTGNQYTSLGIGKSFTSAQNGVNNITSFMMGVANGTNAAVVPLMTLGRARFSNSTIFGANIIANADPGLTNVKLVGTEIDVEPSAGVIAAAGSGGLFINMFSTALPGPAIQISGVDGGTFNNGIVLGAVASNGAGLAAGGGETMGSLINASAANTFTHAAVVLGTGVAKGIEFGTGGGGVSPYLYGDSANNLIAQLGASGAFVINRADATTIVYLGNPGTVGALPTCSSGRKGALFEVMDANSPTWNGALSGGGTSVVLALCDGSVWRAH